MVRFLIKRPIAVVMAFLALVIIGVITYSNLPISLLPNIAIPQITVQVDGGKMSARELESAVIKPLRRQMQQVGKLREIKSETRDKGGIIRLKFAYGTNTNLSFIEVNEKIDAAMSYLPKDISRPKVIKASATDIPVFYLNLSLKDDKRFGKTNEEKFIQLSKFAGDIVKRRIEQLPQVAIADVTGIIHRCVKLEPDVSKLQTAHIQLEDIEQALKNNNINPGSMLIRDGYYEYNIKFSSILRTVKDIEQIYISKNGKLYRLKDIAKLSIVKQKEKGLSLVNGKKSVSIGVIKQVDETMDSLNENLQKTIKNLKESYPEIEFVINRNQTELLDYTISNLQQNLLLGFILVFIVALMFLGDIKSPFIIGLGMLVSLIISFVFFYLFEVSLNIISISGMILALGMMIDSSIIITDIITQYREKGLSLIESCVKGTNEVITPILSSTFTTIAVFVPLVFISGIAGAIFFDQAFAVSVGLLVSYFTGITLLPVLYHIVYGGKFSSKMESSFFRMTQRKSDKLSFSLYDRGMKYVFSHKTLFIVLTFIMLPTCVLLFNVLPKENMPYVERVETVLHLDWNENIHIYENEKRINELLKYIDTEIEESAVYIGQQQYMLEKDNKLSSSESQVYIRVDSPDKLDKIEELVNKWFVDNYKNALISFKPQQNIFEKIFETDESYFVSELFLKDKKYIEDLQKVFSTQKEIDNIVGSKSEKLSSQSQIMISVDKNKLLRYGVYFEDVQRLLKTAFSENEITVLRSYEEYLPIILSGKPRSIYQILSESMVPARNVNNISRNTTFKKLPLSSLLTSTKVSDVKTIIAGKNGEYIPLVYKKAENLENSIKEIKEKLKTEKIWDVNFSGSFFSSRKMLGELVVVLLISVLLMYFILAAQFESFLQPLIVLMELPIDIAFGLLVLYLSGNTLNLMSAIGLVVTCGIIINDSILKIDMMNDLRRKGEDLMDAIHIAGHKRLRAIIMTTLTTVFAMVPILFSFDMGSSLQKPLAVAMISTMLIGTLVSLFVIPLIYWIIYRNTNTKKE